MPCRSLVPWVLVALVAASTGCSTLHAARSAPTGAPASRSPWATRARGRAAATPPATALASALASARASLGLSPSGAAATRGAHAARFQDDAPPGETTVNIPLWPLVEWVEQADGSQDVSALFLYASHTTADGELESIRVVNYLSGPDYTVFFPLYYDVGPEGQADTGIVPLAFWGPGYGFYPLALSAWWRADDGAESTWITPLYHSTLDARGELVSRHLLTWFQTPEGWLLFPFAWSFGESGARRSAILPFWVRGRDSWFAPLLLSGGWRRADGGNTLWITPLYHHTARPGRPTSFHVLTYFQDEHTRVLFPLAYVHDAGRGTHWGVFPLYLDGPGWWFSPALLSGVHDGSAGERTTWITPLFHHTRRPDAPDSFHALTYFQGPRYKVFFPLAYSVGDEGARYSGVIPLWFGYPSGWLAPLLLSGSWSEFAGERTTWITPLFHRTERVSGPDSFHVLTYFQGPDYKVLFPLAYSIGPEGARHRGLFPLWFESADLWVCPPLLSARWSDAPGETSTWVTPFFHYTAREQRPDSFHLLNYVQGPGYQVFFPLAYRYGPPGERHAGVVPLWFSGPDWWLAPLLLSAGWHTSGGHGATWITPLHMGGPGWWFSPVLLSGQWDGPGGESTTLVTPLFHHTSRPLGGDSWHLLNWFQGPHYKVFFPLAYRVGPPGAVYQGLLPLYLDGPDWGCLPPLLSYWSERPDGASTVWATPLYHHRYAADGRLLDRHLLNFVQVEDFTTLFPVYWDWTNASGDARTLLAPLYWQSRYADGDFAASVLPPLFAYRESNALNTSLLYQSIPFSYQDAGDDWELNVLWRLFHRRVQGELSTTVVGPLWYSETRPDLPMDYKLLGGLVARDVFETRGTYRNRWLWFLAGDEQPIDG